MANNASAPSFTHPRRRLASPSLDPESLLESLSNMSIRKGTTFHSKSTNDSELLDPFEKSISPVSRSLTSRSTTCPKELEDLLVGAGERRTLDFLAQVDEAVSNNSKEQLGSILSEPDVLPVPACFSNGTPFRNTLPDLLEDQAYDSGLGSSISSEGTIKVEIEEGEEVDKKFVNRGRRSRKSSASGSAITRSISGASATGPEHILSHFAVIQIHRYIIKPILAEAALQDFHPLVSQIPRRIGDKQINNLRDLEKTLIFLAPDYSRSPAAYLRFCETSIHCLHATVNATHESDQRLPADRPYTNHYFLDLVQQIRRYAQILAANRERQAKGEDVDDMDVTATPLELRGGVTQTGSPAQLGYRSKGQLISLATGQHLPEDDVAVSSKRPMSDVVDNDDGVPRSMARRKKGELPKTYVCPVAECDKQFNRPCDRTKHLKTHERPHKCSDASCEFSTKGFPTEKERDRHWSDRHDPNAKTWECQFKDSDNCPYSSKREHNLKSHMEKAHGWEYVRSKGVKNVSKPVDDVDLHTQEKGKVAVKPRSSIASASTQSTPFTISDASPTDSAHLGVFTPISPYSTHAGPSPMESLIDHNPTNLNYDYTGDFNTDMFGASSLAIPDSYPYTPSLSDGRRYSEFSSSNGTPVLTGNNGMSHGLAFGDIPTTIPPTPDDLDFSNSLFTKNWNNQADSAMAYENVIYEESGSHIISPSAYGFSSQTHPGLRNDLTFTTTFTTSQDYTEAGPDAERAEDKAFEGLDFQLDHYMSSTGVNGALFEDGTGFDEMGSGFDETGSQLNDMGSQLDLDNSVDTNPYKIYFPEIQ